MSIEGGGAWVVDGGGVAHFLFTDGTAAHQALEAAGIQVLEEREVLVQRLKQDVLGQLGLLTRRLAEAGVNIKVLYSDHNHRLFLVDDDPVRGREVSEIWAGESRLKGRDHGLTHGSSGGEKHVPLNRSVRLLRPV
jgi:hypothetical protein